MRFEKQTFTDDVTLDFNEFIDCEIKDCVVFYYGGQFTLVRTILANVNFGLGGPANDTLRFLRLVRSANPKAFDSLLDQGDQPTPDQSVTIN